MKVLVTGDSWAAGDWNLPNNTVSHVIFSPILVDLFKNDGCTVIHHPHPGQSDLPSFLKIQENIKNVNFVIFFKTQVFRYFSKKNRQIAEPNKKQYNFIKGADWPSFEDYLNFTKKELCLSDSIIKEMNSYGFYFIFSNFVENYLISQNLDLSLEMLEDNIIYKHLFKDKEKIMLIGGIDSIKTNFKFKYQINSLLKFLINCDDNYYSVCDLDLKSFVNLVKKSKLKNNLEDILIQLEKHINKTVENFNKQKSDQKYFFYDSGHPNKDAINLYYKELIKPKLKEFII